MVIAFNFFYLKRPINIIYFYCFIIFLFLSLIPSLYWFDIRYFTQVFLVLLTLLSLSIYSREEIEKAVKLVSNFLLVILIFAIVSAIITFFNEFILYEGINPDGRGIRLYLLTFSNAGFSYMGKVLIRPSGIYDEPGALSFITCILVCSRYLLKLNNRKTVLILLLGFVTFSLAHLIFTILFLSIKSVVSLKRSISFDSLKYVFVFLSLIFILVYSELYLLFDELLINRLSSLGNDEFAGNRTKLIYNALSYFNVQTFFFGLDSLCTYDANLCTALYGNVRDNPLSPLIVWGIFVAWIFYFHLFFVLFSSLKAIYLLPIIAIIPVLLQRPSILLPGYEILYLVLGFLIYKYESKNIYNYRSI